MKLAAALVILLVACHHDPGFFTPAAGALEWLPATGRAAEATAAEIEARADCLLLGEVRAQSDDRGEFRRDLGDTAANHGATHYVIAQSAVEALGQSKTLGIRGAAHAYRCGDLRYR